MSYQIFDLDNCISDDSWRIPHIQHEADNDFIKFHDYHSLSAFDVLKNEEAVRTKSDIIILTARPVIYHAITMHWLELHNITITHLLMRSVHDHRSSVVVKKELLNVLFNMANVPIREIEAAHDDDPKVVRLYHDLGLNAVHMKIHDVPYKLEEDSNGSKTNPA